MPTGDIYGVAGTPVVWRDSGGNAVMTLGGLAAGQAREGARYDFGTGARPMGFRWGARTQYASAPIAGAGLEIYAGLWDDDATPDDAWGELSGNDAVYSTAAGVAKRYSLRLLGVLEARTASVGPYITGGTIWVPARHVSLFAYNGASQALAPTVTYASLIRLTPIYPQIQG